MFLKILRKKSVLKVKIWYKGFSVDFAEFSRKSILQNICERTLTWNEAMKKCIQINIFKQKPVRVPFEVQL